VGGHPVVRSHVLTRSGRVYLPELAQFDSIDEAVVRSPASCVAGGIHRTLYGYAGQNPMVLFDRDGRLPNSHPQNCPPGSECGGGGGYRNLGTGGTQTFYYTSASSLMSSEAGPSVSIDYGDSPSTGGGEVRDDAALGAYGKPANFHDTQEAKAVAKAINTTIHDVAVISTEVTATNMAMMVAAATVSALIGTIVEAIAPELVILEAAAEEAATVGTVEAVEAQAARGVGAASRAGYNGVQGPVQMVTRVTRDGSRAARIQFPDKSILDVSMSRVKEFIQNLHPKAPPGSLQRVIFDDAIEGTKGLKRVPGPEDLWWLE